MNDEMRKELAHIHFRVCGRDKHGNPRHQPDRVRLKKALSIKARDKEAGNPLDAINHYINAVMHKLNRSEK